MIFTRSTSGDNYSLEIRLLEMQRENLLRQAERLIRDADRLQEMIQQRMEECDANDASAPAAHPAAAHQRNVPDHPTMAMANATVTNNAMIAS